jgi:hypothetical protein
MDLPDLSGWSDHGCQTEAKRDSGEQIPASTDALPSVTVVMSLYNEKKVTAEKIAGMLTLTIQLICWTLSLARTAQLTAPMPCWEQLQPQTIESVALFAQSEEERLQCSTTWSQKPPGRS